MIDTMTATDLEKDSAILVSKAIWPWINWTKITCLDYKNY